MSSAHSISQEIRQRLAAVRSKTLGVEITCQAQLFVALLFSLAITVILAELLFQLDSTTRTILVILFFFSLAAFASWFILRPVFQRLGILTPPSDHELARHIGEWFPSIRDRLLNLLQLHEEASRGSRYSPELIDASFEDFAGELQETDFLRSVDRTPILHSRKILFLSLFVALIPLLAVPSSVGESLIRLVHFDREFVEPPSVSFEISPGDVEVVKGRDVGIAVRVHANDPVPPRSMLSLRWRPVGQMKLEERQLMLDSSGSAATTLNALRASTEYFAEFRGERSMTFHLSVVDRPVIRALRVRLDFPSYTRLPSRIQEEFVGDVTALPGTRITLTGSASKSLAFGRLTFDPDSVLQLSVRGRQFSARFRLSRESSYKIEVKDDEGLLNAEPVTYRLNIVADEVPNIAILEPEPSIDIADATSVPLLLQIKDDFGFSRLRLGYRLAHSRYEAITDAIHFVDVPLPPRGKSVETIPYSWDLQPLHLAPEDVVEYFAEVYDNDTVNGPKRAQTSMYLLRLPSLEEVFADLDESHQETIDEISRSVEQARELKEKIASISEDLKKNKDPDWQQQKKMEETAKRYQELQQKMDDVRKKLDTMVDQMSQQNVLSPETLEKYQELQQMLEQLDSAELQNALKQLQQAMQNVNREQLQKALEQVTFSEERFRESIERTLDLLKRIQIEQKLDEVKTRAEELSTEQDSLANETAQEKPNPENLAKRQEDLKKKLENLQEKSEDVQRRMEEFFTEMPEQELQAANEQLKNNQTAQKMEKSARQLKAGQKQQAQQLQEEVKKDLQNFSQQLTQLQQQMLQQQQQYIINAMRRATNDLLELSKKEESLKDESKTAPPGSSQLRENAQQQLNVLNGLGNVVDGLSELAKRSFVTTPEMGKAIGEAAARMQAAMRSLDIRSGVMASQEQNKAMESLNRAAMEVQRSLQSLMQQSGGQGSGGLLGQLQTMAAQQMSINMRMGAQDAARLAAEQEMLRKSLEELNKEAKETTDGKRILGDLDRIAKEMQEVVRNLEQNDVGRETIQKQERILSRLLDAARSTRERDFEKKRRSTTGTQVARRSPGELDPSLLEGRDRLREDLLKAMEEGYSKDYQELIRKYFDELQKAREEK